MFLRALLAFLMVPVVVAGIIPYMLSVYDPFKAAEFATKYLKGDDFDINVLFRK